MATEEVDKAVEAVLQNPKALGALVHEKRDEKIAEVLATYGITLAADDLGPFTARLRNGQIPEFKAKNLLEHYNWLASSTVKEGTLPPSWRT